MQLDDPTYPNEPRRNERAAHGDGLRSDTPTQSTAQPQGRATAMAPASEQPIPHDFANTTPCPPPPPPMSTVPHRTIFGKTVKGSPMPKTKTGLYANIHAKKKRIAAGSDEKMRKPGSKGAPTDAAFKQAAKKRMRKSYG